MVIFEIGKLEGTNMTLVLRNLSTAECCSMLEKSRFGHLACCKDDQPYVVPVYFAYEDGTIYSFAMVGRKIEWMRQNGKVCLQVEQRRSDQDWWSVVVDGRFAELPDNDRWHDQRIHAWSLLQKHWDWWEIGSLKTSELDVAVPIPHVFYGIHVHEISGRRAEPA